ncbi:OadG family protein [Nitrospinota bacterium]
MPLLGSAIELTIIGMGVVFLSLLGLMCVIQILNRIFAKKSAAEEAPAAPEAEGDAGEIPLVLAAAAGYFLETERGEVFIPEVVRSGDSGWARRARSGRTYPRRPR